MVYKGWSYFALMVSLYLMELWVLLCTGQDLQCSYNYVFYVFGGDNQHHLSRL